MHIIAELKAYWFMHSSIYWLIGRMPKRICNHELSIVIVIIVCDQFSYTNTKSKKVPSLHGSGTIIQLHIHESSSLHVLGISALKLAPLQLACLETLGCAEFCPLNTKEIDFLAQNVFSQKWIIIQL